MLKLAIFAVALSAACALSALDAQWAVFKANYNKEYSSKLSEEFRKAIFAMHLRNIEAHNLKYAKGLSSYYMGINEYSDLTNEEFRTQLKGLLPNLASNRTGVNPFAALARPTSVDWRKKGYVTGIKNQGQCGSCWAFSATGSLEGQHFKDTGKLVSLSESNLVDCSQNWGNMGCSGGLMDFAFQYVIDNKGIDTEKSYPYKPEDRPCKFKAANVGATEKAFTDVTIGSEDALQDAIANVGPISVAIDATENFQGYRGGIFNDDTCGNQRSDLDHGVLAVGYGSQGSKDFYIVKNSWGTSWGEKGYIRMTRNKNNQCGIATLASYPTGVY